MVAATCRYSRPRRFEKQWAWGSPPPPPSPSGLARREPGQPFFCSRSRSLLPREHEVQESGPLAAQDGEAAAQIRRGPEFADDRRGVPEDVLGGDCPAD